MLEEYSRVYARIDIDAIKYNLESMRKNIPDGTRIMAVVKTDAYGHGATRIALSLENVDYIWGYAVATAEEAFELRDAGAIKPILVLGYTFPYAYRRMLLEGVRPSVFRMDMAQELSDCGQELVDSGELTELPCVHIAVDTGMSRIGVTPDEKGADFVSKVMNMPGIQVEGIFTHFARADEADLSNAREREKVFADFVKSVEETTGKKIPLHHCANSASIISVPESSMDMVRAGVTMYGMWPSEDVPRDIVSLKPTMELRVEFYSRSSSFLFLNSQLVAAI